MGRLFETVAAAALSKLWKGARSPSASRRAPGLSIVKAIVASSPEPRN